MTRAQRVFVSGLVFLTVAAFGRTPGHAATSSINPVADAFVTTGPSSSPSPAPDLTANNYGGAGVLDVAAAGLPHGEAQSVLRFDLSSTKTAFDTTFGVGQWTIQSITLQLTAVAAGQNAFIINTPAAGNFTASWMQSDSWVEGTGKPNAPTTTGITYASLPTFLGGGDQTLGTFSFDGSSSGSLTFSLSLASGLTTDVLTGNLLSLQLLAADSSVSYLFNSRSAASGQPVLTVTAVPEPSSLVLGLVGLAFVGWRRTRRR